MKRICFTIALIFNSVLVGTNLAQEISLAEEFALAQDREQALARFIPGTESYYYFHALYYQHTEQYDKVESLLSDWTRRHGETELVTQIRHRQALLRYATDADRSLKYIQERLNLQFNHEREVPQAERALPVSLNEDLISLPSLLERALASANDLSRIETRGLALLAEKTLNKNQLRSLLQRLELPDFENLPALIAQDLKAGDAPAFGSYKIHQRLTLQQLDELLRLQPGLLNQQNFINIYLTRLRPHDDTLFYFDREQRQAYLQRLWAFASRLGDAHNSLKANLLHQQLEFNLHDGVYDKELLISYLKLPRNVHYINPDYLSREARTQAIADLGENFSDRIALPPIGIDEPVVREHLQHFLKSADNFDEFLPWVRDDYLRRLFAETKIVNGLGDREKWASLLTPEEYQALLERVDLDFALTNPKFHNVSETVEVELFTKNISKLIVKVFEINTANYFKSQGREINTDVNLDGLVANWEEVYSYADPPLHRIARKFTFDSLTQRGIYVIDFIGNGKSSRVLVRKGRLHHVMETTFAGHLFAVFNEQNQQVKNAHIWLDGRRFEADQHGFVLIPFSTQPKRQRIVLGDASGFSSLEWFEHQAETYTLRSGIFVDRESLIRAEKTQVIIRPQLLAGTMPAPLSLLEDVKLNITSLAQDGTSATQDFSDITLEEGKETSVEFQVPDRLSDLTFTLSANIKNISQVIDQRLSVTVTFQVNQIDKTTHISDLFLIDGDTGYRLEVRGKSGEARTRHPVFLQLKHRFFTEPVQLSLQTDHRGWITLGELPGIETVSARLNSNLQQNWALPSSRINHYTTIHAIAGEAIQIPVPHEWTELTEDKLALFELRGGTIFADRFSAVRLEPGVVILEDLKPGDYDLFFKESADSIRIRVAAATRTNGYAMNSARKLELRDGQRPFIQQVTNDDKSVMIQIGNSHAETRVHIIATRHLPRFNVFQQFSVTGDTEPTAWGNAMHPSQYMAGRNIGDELRYILDRHDAEKYPGNMLTRPSLLLNPWALRETESTIHAPEAGQGFGQARPGQQAEPLDREQKQEGGIAATSDLSSLDFLSNPSVMLLSLSPDENGVVTIERSKLGDKHYLQITLADPFHVAVTHTKINETEVELRDLRLADGLDPEQHFIQSKEHSILDKDEEFVLADPLSGQFQTFDDLGDVHRLFMAMTGNETLNEFAFVLDWPKKSEDEKRQLYSKFACHELHFFLKQKDPEFFRSVVIPYLGNKRDKTFLDHWLLNADLQHYVDSWQFDQLHTVEQILLSKVLGELERRMIQLIEHRYDINPTDITEFDKNLGYVFSAGGLDGQSLGDQLKTQAGKATGRYRQEDPAQGAAPGQPPPMAMPQRAGRAQDETKRMNELGVEAIESDEKATSEQGLGGDGGGSDLSRRSLLILGGQPDVDDGVDGLVDTLIEARAKLEQFYQRLKPTQEWVENNYYKLPIDQHVADRVPVNRFWRDYVNHVTDDLFLSPYFPEATSNFTEMMFALAVLDLPFEAPEHKTEFTEEQLNFQAAGPLVAFYQQIKPALFERRGSTVLISENFFRNDDRFQQDGDRRYDKFVTDEFLISTVYGGQVVITNPTSTPQTMELLIQIPVGAIPVSGSQATHSRKLDLNPFSTTTHEYFFYFPNPGDYPHFPAHASANDRAIAVAENLTFKVVDEPSTIDRTSWAFVSQHGSEQEVIEYLENENILAVDLNRIAFRMKDQAFFNEVTRILKDRFVHVPLLWSYSVMHNESTQLRDYLSRTNSILNQVGSYIDTPILTVNPVDRHWYEHREFWPLINARAHQLGGRRRVLNSAVHEQYHRLLQYLIAKPELDAYDHLAVTYYLLLQDRVTEAKHHFEQLDVRHLASRLQFDYLAAYLAMYQDQPARAAEIAKSHLQHPVKRWRDLFASVVAHVDEIESGVANAIDMEDPAQSQAAAAARAPSFEFEIDGGKIQLKYQNLSEITVRYYLMDIELLFSRNPFVQQQSDGFSLIRPNHFEQVQLDVERRSQMIDIPESLGNRNVLVEISDNHRTQSVAYYANSMQVQLIENFGQLNVSHLENQKPLNRVYVKVYARKADGSVHFYKDGYTDLRGRFDYASLSDQKLEDVTRFALLILSEENGAIIREAGIPKE